MMHHFRLRAIVPGIAVLALGGAAHASTFFNLFGDVSPADRSLTDVHVLGYVPENGGPLFGLGSWLVGDAPISVVTPIDIDSGAVIDVVDGLYAIIGVHEDGGVSITLPDSAFSEGVTEWSDLFTTDEATVQGWLVADDNGELSSWFNNEVVIPGYATPFGTRATMVDFSTAETNGDGIVNFEIVPAPSGLAVAGLSGLVALRRRR